MNNSPYFNRFGLLCFIRQMGERGCQLTRRVDLKIHPHYKLAGKFTGFLYN